MARQFNEDVAAIEGWAGTALAKPYREVLHRVGGECVGDAVRFYAADELIERNECYETKRYCPGFLTIGDDGGGRAIVINPALASKVFVVGHGTMTVEDFELVADSFSDWVESNCPL